MKYLIIFAIASLGQYILTEGCLGGGGSSSSSSGSSKRSRFASTADSYIGSTKWAKAGSHRTGPGTWKCNVFVAEVIEEAGGSVPHRHWYTWSPIGAGEWGNPSSSYLTADRCWQTVSSPSVGDVAGDGTHVAIVTGSRLTTSAAEFEVVKNDWGFDPPSRVANVFWRYVC